jgi:hypothetical protein
MKIKPIKPVNFYPSFSNSVEITEQAFNLLKGNDQKSWKDYGSNELSEWSIYINEGVKLMSLCNFLSGVTQYYVQDINA